MSMILLEPANTILQTSGEDQAADHLINGVFGNCGELAETAARGELASDETGPTTYTRSPPEGRHVF
jgi:hypothetical protein